MRKMQEEIFYKRKFIIDFGPHVFAFKTMIFYLPEKKTHVSGYKIPFQRLQR
jgi:hypothetical protein